MGTATSVPSERAATVDEVPLTLTKAPPPRLLGLVDQVALWGNLGISILLLLTASFVMAPDPTLPPLSLGAALVAIVVGAVIGIALLGLGGWEMVVRGPRASPSTS